MVDRPAIAGAILQIQRLVQQGKLVDAETACHALLVAAPEQPAAWSMLGWVHLLRGQLPEAEAALRQTVALNPASASDWSNLSFAFRGQGNAHEAAQAGQQAAQLDPANPSHWINLGAALTDLQQWTDARIVYQQAISLNPNNAAAWGSLGQAEQTLDNIGPAIRAYEQSLALNPQSWPITSRYTELLIQSGDSRRACAVLHRLLQISPDSVDAWLKYGSLSRILEQLDAAEAAFRNVLTLRPLDPQATYELASALFSRSALTEAEAIIRPLVVEHPEECSAWSLLGGIQHAQGKINEALKSFRHSVIQAGSSPDAGSRLLAAMQYADDASPDKLLAEHRRWHDLHARPLMSSVTSAPRITAPDAPLRLGFLSGDFRQHPIAFLILPALEHLDKTRSSIVCYSDALADDYYTERFRRIATDWRLTAGLSDDSVVNQIRMDEIDVLVDLMGHAGTRLLVFARQSAPMQVTWLGYVGTTGLVSMNFLLADWFHVRAGEEHNYVENVLRLPNGYACYGPPARAPEVNCLPALAAGCITYGCLNNLTKYTPRLLDTWAAILLQVPGSRLLLKYGALGDPGVRASVLQLFADRGITNDRILIEGGGPHAEFLAAYNRIDLALDTQPYSGGLTTCEALWMGVPVITFPGQTFAGRHTTSHLSNAGYPEFIAPDLPGYIELAVHWANRPNDLATIRSQMRDKVRASPLCDAATFARDFLNLLTQAYHSKFPTR
jgi:protein O-GlcNAc transferase